MPGIECNPSRIKTLISLDIINGDARPMGDVQPMLTTKVAWMCGLMHDGDSHKRHAAFRTQRPTGQTHMSMAWPGTPQHRRSPKDTTCTRNDKCDVNRDCRD